MKKSTLIISDIHLPFEHKKALKHCVKVAKEFKCKDTIFTGDIFDHHRLSRFKSEPDADSATNEAKLTIKKVKKWAEAFPKADIILGNHDLVLYRQAKEFGMPKMYLKQLQKVYNLPPTWKFHKRLVRDGVLYLHKAGSGKYGVVNKAREMSMSVVAGHSHRFPGVIYFSNPLKLFFGLQVGCLINKNSYAMRYSDNEVTLGCGVVISREEAYFVPMKM